MYAKLESGKIIYAPQNYKVDEILIVNFDKNINLMKKYGFKEIIDIKPTYDYSKEYLNISGYNEIEDNIIINYEIKQIEVNQDPTLEERILELEKVNKEQDELIDTTMLATDEMFMLLEPLLSSVNSLERSVSKMVDMYVAMVQRGLKTIEQVPERYREQVKEVLTKLES